MNWLRLALFMSFLWCATDLPSQESIESDSYGNQDFYKIDTSFQFKPDQDGYWAPGVRNISFHSWDGEVVRRIRQELNDQGEWDNKSKSDHLKKNEWTDQQLQYHWNGSLGQWQVVNRTTVENFEWSTEDRKRYHERFDTARMRWDTFQIFERAYLGTSNKHEECYTYFDDRGRINRGKKYVHQKDDNGDLVQKTELNLDTLSKTWIQKRKTTQTYEADSCVIQHEKWNEEKAHWFAEPRRTVLQYFNDLDIRPINPNKCNPYREVRERVDYRLDDVFRPKKKIVHAYELSDTGWIKIQMEFGFNLDRSLWMNKKRQIQHYNNNGRLLKDKTEEWDEEDNLWQPKSRTIVLPSKTHQKTVREEWDNTNGRWKKKSIMKSVPCYPVDEIKT